MRIKITILLECQLKHIILCGKYFSVYHIKTTSDYIVNNFNNDSSYNNFLKLIKERSIYKFDVDLNSNDNVLTLSTCYSKSERL